MKSNLSPQESKAAVDAYIADLIDKRIQQAGEIHESYKDMWLQIKRVFNAGGKRIRPYLVVIGNGELNDKIVPVAAAQELLHMAMLMHDDVIDEDTVRHGELNINGAYQQAYSNYLPAGRRPHYANSMAILVGDALISEAYIAINNSDYSAKIKQRVGDELARAIFEVIGGELIDVEAAFVTDRKFDPMTIYHYKTASYSFNGPLLAGAHCAELGADATSLLQELGSKLGVAFQIQDDLLGVFGDDAQTGKSTYTDLREGKRTLLIAHYEPLMTTEQRQRFKKSFGKPTATDAELAAIKQDIQASGASKQTQAVAQQYFQEAEAILDQLPSDDVRKVALGELMAKIQGRQS